LPFVLPSYIVQSAVIPAVTRNWRIPKRITRRRARKITNRRLTKLIREGGGKQEINFYISYT
jgi:hypothetical protein